MKKESQYFFSLHLKLAAVRCEEIINYFYNKIAEIQTHNK